MLNGFTLYLLKALSVSLALTLGIELLTAILMKKRGHTLIFIVLANVITNPAAVLIFLSLKYRTSFPLPLAAAILEILVVLTEALIFRLTAPDIRRPLLFSLCLNAISYGVGLLISLLR